MADPIIPLTEPAPDKTGKNPAPPKAASPPDTASGTTTLTEEVALEGEILAYQSLERIARMIALEARDVIRSESGEAQKNARILFLQPAVSQAFQHHQGFVLATDHLESVFKEITEQGEKSLKLFPENVAGNEREPMGEPITAALGIATAAVTAIAGIAGLFRQDVTIQGIRMSPSREAFENSVSRSLLHVCPGLELRNARLLLYRPGQAAQLSHSRLLERLKRVEQARASAAFAVQMVGQRVIEIQFLLEPPAPGKPPEGRAAAKLRAELIALKPALTALSGMFTEANTRWQGLIATLGGTPPPASDDNTKGAVPAALFASIQAGEELLASLQADAERNATYLLSVDVISLRANFKTRKGTLANLGGRDSESYSGGAIGTYTLLDLQGRIRAAGTHRFRWPYLKFDDRDAVDARDGNSFDETFRAME